MIQEEHTVIRRKKELKELKSLLELKVASPTVIKGRRRVGKSRLTREFAKNFTYAYTFVGLAPTKGITDTHQRNYFITQMDQQGIVQNSGETWADLFLDVATH